MPTLLVLALPGGPDIKNNLLSKKNPPPSPGAGPLSFSASPWVVLVVVAAAERQSCNEPFHSEATFGYNSVFSRTFFEKKISHVWSTK